MVRETLERKRARYAWQRIGGRAPAKDIRSELEALPVNIRTQGLTVAAATLQSRKQEWILETLFTWLSDESPQAPFAGKGKARRRPGENLIQECLDVPQPLYLAAQAESIELATHLKTLAGALAQAQGEEETGAVPKESGALRGGKTEEREERAPRSSGQ